MPPTHVADALHSLSCHGMPRPCSQARRVSFLYSHTHTDRCVCVSPPHPPFPSPSPSPLLSPLLGAGRMRECGPGGLLPPDGRQRLLRAVRQFRVISVISGDLGQELGCISGASRAI